MIHLVATKVPCSLFALASFSDSSPLRCCRVIRLTRDSACLFSTMHVLVTVSGMLVVKQRCPEMLNDAVYGDRLLQWPNLWCIWPLPNIYQRQDKLRAFLLTLAVGRIVTRRLPSHIAFSRHLLPSSPNFIMSAVLVNVIAVS